MREITTSNERLVVFDGDALIGHSIFYPRPRDKQLPAGRLRTLTHTQRIKRTAPGSVFGLERDMEKFQVAANAKMSRGR